MCAWRDVGGPDVGAPPQNVMQLINNRPRFIKATVLMEIPKIVELPHRCLLFSIGNQKPTTSQYAVTERQKWNNFNPSKHIYHILLVPLFHMARLLPQLPSSIINTVLSSTACCCFCMQIMRVNVCARTICATFLPKAYRVQSGRNPKSAHCSCRCSCTQPPSGV